MIDFHSHLDLYPQAIEVAEKANRINQFTLAVTTSPRAWLATSKVFRKFENIHTAIGLHPEIIEEKCNELQLMLENIKFAKFVGEVGIDGTRDNRKTIVKQKEIFSQILSECEKNGGKILSIHSRGATKEVLSLLEKFPLVGKSILHWFTGTSNELQCAIEMNCYFSVNQLMLTTDKGKNMLSQIPLDLILPESDGPFATINSKPIMPWETNRLDKHLAETFKISQETVRLQLSANYKRITEKL